jgi:chemotaxis protein CheD
MLAVRAAGNGTIAVGIGDAAIARGQGRLSTIGLGSCVAVAIFDPVVRLGALLHFQLSDSTQDLERARRQPWLFGDFGIAALAAAVQAQGGQVPRSRVTVVGGAQLMASVATAQIGKRNVLAARKALWKAGYLIEREIVGGNVGRSVALDVATGDVTVREHGGVV